MERLPQFKTENNLLTCGFVYEEGLCVRHCACVDADGSCGEAGVSFHDADPWDWT